MDDQPVTSELQIVPSIAKVAVRSAASYNDNPSLPVEVRGFKKEPLKTPFNQLTESQWSGALHATEVGDMHQQIKLRPYFASGVFLLILIQNLGIWWIVVWSIQRGDIEKLQVIFSALIAGTLTQSYFILRFITNKIFSDIDYHNGTNKDK